MDVSKSMKDYPWKRARIIELPQVPNSHIPSPHSTTSQLIEPLSISPVFCGACGMLWSINEMFCGICGTALLQANRISTSATVETPYYRFS